MTKTFSEPKKEKKVNFRRRPLIAVGFDSEPSLFDLTQLILQRMPLLPDAVGGLLKLYINSRRENKNGGVGFGESITLYF